VTGLAHECPDTDRLSFERTAGPSLPNTFGTAWPHKSSPSIRVAHHWSARTAETTP